MCYMCYMCYIRYTSSPPPHNRECSKTQQNRKNFRENRKNFREDRENSMVSEPSSTSEANKFFAKNSCSPKTYQSAKGLYGNGEITTPKRRSRRGSQQLTEAAQDCMLSL